MVAMFKDQLLALKSLYLKMLLWNTAIFNSKNASLQDFYHADFLALFWQLLRIEDGTN